MIWTTLKKMRWQFSLAAAVYLTFWLYYDRSGGAMYSICAAAFHECGHLLALCLLRDTPERICFGIFGIRIERAPTVRLTYAQEQLVSAAGPAANLLLAAVLRPMCILRAPLRRAVYVNLALAAFNLLPIRPLDGGELLHALLCRRMLPAAADARCKKIAAITGIPLAAIGLWSFVRSARHWSLALLSFSMITLILAFSAYCDA